MDPSWVYPTQLPPPKKNHSRNASVSLWLHLLDDDARPGRGVERKISSGMNRW